jgi:Ca2+-binding RTX toxin-like protein
VISNLYKYLRIQTIMAILTGTSTSETLNGVGAENDILSGLAGNDLINGGLGNDALYGEAAFFNGKYYLFSNSGSWTAAQAQAVALGGSLVTINDAAENQWLTTNFAGQGNLWIGSDGGGVCKYDGKTFTNFTKKQGLSNLTVFSIIEDKMGNLWFGTYGSGVSKYEPSIKEGQVGTFTHYTEKEGLSNNIVFSVLEDKTGNIWFGTYGGGVSKYNGDSFTHFTEKEGLSNNIVISIISNGSGKS